MILAKSFARIRRMMAARQQDENCIKMCAWVEFPKNQSYELFSQNLAVIWKSRFWQGIINWIFQQEEL